MIPNNNQRLAERNLDQFAAIDQSSGWTKARLIAASVEPGKPGRPAENGIADTNSPERKLSLRQAADRLGMGRNTVSGYLDAWGAAAKDGLVAPAADLTPEDSWSADLPDADWSEYYVRTTFSNTNGNTHGDDGQVDPPAPAPAPSPVSTFQDLTPAQRTEAVTEAIKEDPAVAIAAGNALTERDKGNTFSGRLARAKEREEAEGKERGGTRYLIADGLLVVAKKKIREAINELHESRLTDEHRDLIRERVSEIVKLAQMLRSEVDGTGSVDWDAELAALMGGE